jgi:hypothetical protein
MKISTTYIDFDRFETLISLCCVYKLDVHGPSYLTFFGLVLGIFSGKKFLKKA